MNNPNACVQSDHVTQRIGEQPSLTTAFESEGMNLSSAIGIATDNPGVDPNSWTLLDQYGASRFPQNAPRISFAKDSFCVVSILDNSEGQPPIGVAVLTDLTAGWAPAVIPDP